MYHDKSTYWVPFIQDLYNSPFAYLFQISKISVTLSWKRQSGYIACLLNIFVCIPILHSQLPLRYFFPTKSQFFPQLIRPSSLLVQCCVNFFIAKHKETFQQQCVAYQLISKCIVNFKIKYLYSCKDQPTEPILTIRFVHQRFSWTSIGYRFKKNMSPMMAYG